MADLENRGIPTVGIATTEFEQAAAAQSKALGTDPAYVFVPHPIQDRTDAEMQKIADEAVDAIIEGLVGSADG